MLTAAQKQEVLKFVRGLEARTFTFRDVVRWLDLDSDERRNLQRYLDELDSQGIIHRIKRGQYALPSREALVSGILICHRDGYGFVRLEDRSKYGQDIFIPSRNMEEALHGDRVLIKVIRKKRVSRPGRHPHPDAGKPEERLEGTVLRVLERAHPSIVGRYYEHPRFPMVVPLDTRMFQDILIPPQQSKNARNGQVVVVTLLMPPGKNQSPRGRVIEVLGYPGDKDIEYKIVEHKYGLPVEFSIRTEEEAAAITDRVLEQDCAEREDFRDETAVTIDGETARDFDDAVTLEKLPSGHFLLGVHIADVSHYVRDDTALDADAYTRGTSVYFPDRAIPMLPPKLSNGICCLKPNEDRLVFSVIMEIDGHGQVIQRRFTEAVLRSRARMTYTSVARILVQRDPSERSRYAQLLPLFETMEELCIILSGKRYRRGAVDFDLPEAEIEFDRNGRVIRVVPAERNIAHRIIEEFMLLANETVAERLTESGGPALYRVHEEPDPQKVEDFAEFAGALGHRLESHNGQYRPRDFQKFVARLEGRTEGRFLAYLMLRSFMQARYSAENLGHFGLATSEYTHFTSPIRRYPDLILHRLLKECLRKHPSEAWQAKMSARLPEIAAWMSARERNAGEAEREIEKIKKVQFMADKVGDEFEGIVFSVIRQGFFVELLEHYVEGFVPAGTLIDDRYFYQEDTHSFVGERLHRRFALGSKVVVRLDLADQETCRLTFSVVRVLG
ncbi:MAG: ribonuclease R [Acidobacteriia bacterium]|nr:ribonuclease R [Terriglobia bacterium]